jgi:RNA polymerase sigma-70 factor (ECF subfamily)
MFGMAQVSAEKEAILKMIFERITGYATLKIRNVDEARFLAQDTIMLITTDPRYTPLEKEQDLLPVAITVAHYKILEWFRRRERNFLSTDDLANTLIDKGPKQDEALDSKRFQERIYACIDKLGEKCRKLLLLKINGYTFEEIRRHFRIDRINTIYTWDFRCRKALRDLLGRDR